METKINSIFRGLYACVVICIFVLFIFFQLTRTSTESFFGTDVTVLNQGYLITENGKTVLSSRNHNFLYKEAKSGEKIEISIMLPLKLNDYTYMAILSNQQDLWIYVDNQLIKKYSDEEERVLVDYSASTVIMQPLKEEYAGKELRIVYQTVVKSSASKLNCPVIGTQKDILLWMFDNNSWQLLSAILLFSIGIAFILFDGFFKWNHGKNKGLLYLGFFSLLVSVWLICSSSLRLIYFRHNGTADIMMHLALMLCPIPMLDFFDSLMNRKHKTEFQTMVFLALLNVLINIICLLFKISNIVDMLITTHIVILLTCGVCLFTFIDYYKHYKNELADARAVMIGLTGFVAATVIEDINIIFFNSFFVGQYLGLGILFLLIMLAYAAIRGMVLQEKEYQKALNANLEKNTFLATMSHEIRTPINTILGMDEMILRESDNNEILHYAENIKNASRTLLSIINNILDFTKMESGKMISIPSRYELSHLLNDLVSSINLKVKEKGLELVLEIDENIPRTLFGDEVRMKQAVLNVLMNAVKYTNHGSIGIKIHSKKYSLEEIDLFFTISDTGIGIKEEDKDKLFRSFVRLEENRNRSIEGTGLGMAITKQIMDLLGGKISFESEYGRGTTFFLKFRQKVLDEEPVGKIQDWLIKAAKTSTMYVEHYKIELSLLLVDDNEMNLEVIKGLLKKTGVKIDTAQSGMECLQLFAQREYDMILLDHMMPEMDGVETLDRLEKQMIQTGKRIPIVALTANAVAGAREEYIKLGFSYYLSKPVGYKELIEVMQHFYPNKVIKRETVRTMYEEEGEYLEENGIHVMDSLKYVGGDFQQYLHLLALFSSERSNEKRMKIKEAYQKQHWEDYLVYVHALKNSARTIGAVELADLAFEHEKNCKENHYVFMMEHFEELLYEWNRTINIIRSFLEKQTDKAENNQRKSEKINSDEWDSLMDELSGYISQFQKKKAMDLLQKLTSYSLSEKERDEIQKVKEALSDYDYEKALEYLNTIQLLFSRQ